MKTIEEKAQEYSKICKFCEEQNFSPRCTSCEFRGKYQGFLAGATEQMEIDEAHPSDAVIMRILNAIGYEEESWIPIVRKNLEAMEESMRLFSKQ